MVNAIGQVYSYLLRQAAINQLNQQLADLMVALYQYERLCLVHDSEADWELRIICLMGLFSPRAKPQIDLL